MYEQCDRLNVYLNGYKDVPKFLARPNIDVGRSQDHGDLGDAGKFFWSAQIDVGYHATVDDDIEYPTNYVEHMTAKVEEYERKAVVGLHGAVMEQYPRTYYESRRHSYRCRETVRGDHYVHVIGTGTTVYHTSTIKLCLDDFKRPNMADIWFSIVAKEQSVPLVVVAHRGNWLTARPVPGIFWRFKRSKHGFRTQNKIVADHAPWNPIPGE